MDPNRRIAKVHVIFGCLVSGACEATCPEVFEMLDTGVVIRDGAADHFVSKRDQIEEAALGCPVEVIHIEYEDGTRLAPGT